MQIKIFNGPKEKFIEIIPTGRVISLTKMIRNFEFKQQSEISKGLFDEEYDFLVATSDEYAGAAEFFIEDFLTYIDLYSQIYNYEVVYLQNPPIKIIKQLTIDNPNLQLLVEAYNYPSIKKQNLKFIKQQFDNVIYGQPNVKKNILTSLYQLTNVGKHKPVIIMLYGPTSVGKTETVKFITQILNPGKKIFRKQLSMFQNELSINYIFGDRTSSFAKDLLDRETNVILLDEFDKAHPMIYSAFYQLFDEGIYVDKFYEVNLDNTIIFCTTNYLTEKEIKLKLGDPIYSRFDQFIKFDALTSETKKQMIDKIYYEELEKFNEEDQREISKNDILMLLTSKVNQINNAREIRKVLVQYMAHCLIETL